MTSCQCGGVWLLAGNDHAGLTACIDECRNRCYRRPSDVIIRSRARKEKGLARSASAEAQIARDVEHSGAPW